MAPPVPDAPVGKDRVRGIVTGRAGHAAARVCARSAQVEALERHPVVGGADHRARAEQLVEADEPITAAWVNEGRWDVDIAGTRAPAIASIRPLYDPTMERIKS